MPLVTDSINELEYNMKRIAAGTPVVFQVKYNPYGPDTTFTALCSHCAEHESKSLYLSSLVDRHKAALGIYNFLQDFIEDHRHLEQPSASIVLNKNPSAEGRKFRT